MGIVLLVVVIFLPSMYCDLASDYYSFYEIIIPKRLTVEGRDDPVDEASYALFMQGQRQVIHLKVKKDYFVSNFPIYSYHNGILSQEMPFISRDCRYEGYIEGVPGSFVSVNTCSGLKGILIKEKKYYSIEPMNSSRGFEHVLYTRAHQAQVSCSITSEESQGVSSNLQQGSKKPGKAQTLSYLWSQTKYVEMFVVVNSQRFQMWGSNVNETIQGVMDIIALANSFTRAINTEVVLVGMEVWTEGDLTKVTVDLEAALSNFNSWRQKNLLNRVNYDVAHMIVGHHPRENMGQAFLGGACSSGFAAAVESFHHEDVLLFAALMVHELGHNLGIQHDHLACICKDKHFCLMHQKIIKETGFSNCSSDYFYQFLQEHKGACLFNKPWHTGRKRRAANCGDGVVEETEECDCGSACGNHPCCDTTCKLQKEAECSQELCCTMCKLSKKGHLCRPLLDECDLPEYCNGTSKQCPADSYLQDGTNCEGNYYCIGGRCRNPDEQCKELFGPEATSASQDCYTLFNQKGDRFGNCGRSSTNGGSYIRCRDDNKLCGKLVCSGVRILPEIKLQHTVIQVSRETDECWSMDASDSPDNSKDGDVTFGTYCASQKICANYSCIDDIMLNYDCKPTEMCNGKGVCNNLKHCHCEAGFAPPDCKKEGDGGSVDSGPPGKQTEEKPKQEVDKNKPKENEEVIARSLLALFLLFIIALLILCITCGVFQGKGEPAAKPAEAPPVIPAESVPEEAAAPEEVAAPEEAALEEPAAPEEPEEESVEEGEEEGEEEEEEEEELE